MSHRKRHRNGSSGRLYSIDGALADESSSPPAAMPGSFNDPVTADVTLRLEFHDDLIPDLDAPIPFLDLYVRSDALRRSHYFSCLLSDRWKQPDGSSDEFPVRLTLKISRDDDLRRRGPFHSHVAVLRLLHTLDFSGSIASVSDALDMIPVALELVFDDCVRACVRFLEAVPWTEEEEERVLKLMPLLGKEESEELLSRVLPVVSASRECDGMPEAMLHGLIDTAIRRNLNGATVKAFVARILKDFPSRELVERVLGQAFLSSLERVKDYMGKYASPEVRIAENSNEREAIQKVNLHAVLVNVKHLHWLIDRIMELRVADKAVREWSEQEALAADLIKTFRDDTWRNIVPGLAFLVTRCSYRLADAVASGITLAPQQVRMRLVKTWLPVLNVLKDIFLQEHPVGYIFRNESVGDKTLYLDLEETFLKIISTLPLSNAQELLQQCLCFSTRNLDDCPHLTSAFRTWFRRATRSPLNLRNMS
ncbi:BTB/POZ domain-containing protein At3g05675-like [Curcuma longa]|uniref:BTB/POZ domain-containing protein At3g05675-like n=1 Tax=Curcuma longa TaxID=136217 RepID=UPI003D9DF466